MIITTLGNTVVVDLRSTAARAGEGNSSVMGTGSLDEFAAANLADFAAMFAETEPPPSRSARGPGNPGVVLPGSHRPRRCVEGVRPVRPVRRSRGTRYAGGF